MSMDEFQKTVTLAKKFSLAEKILMGIGFYGFVIIGGYGIYAESILWGLIYTGFLVFGFIVLIGYCVCAYCPYIYPDYSDCLFVPFGSLFRKLYKFRQGPMTALDKIGLFIMMSGAVIIPQFWLFKDLFLFTVFWIVCLPTIAGFILYECRKCQHTECLFNRAKLNC
jgi:hypothetical protein